MADTVFVTYRETKDGPPFPELEIAATGQVVARGEAVEVSKAVAGRAPKGKPGEEGYDPGEGLLAQVDVWREAHKAEVAAAKRKAEGETEEAAPAAPIEEG